MPHRRRAACIGLIVALLRGSSLAPVRWAAAAYVWLFRAIPTLLQLLFVWNALPQLIPSLRDPWFTPFLAAFLALSLNESAYMAEIIRSGLASVDRGQMLAGKTLGLRSDQIFRLITLPQMIRVIIPPTGNEFITLLKLTSLASVISLRELLTVTSQTVAVNFRFAELYARGDGLVPGDRQRLHRAPGAIGAAVSMGSRERAVRTMPTFVRAGVGNR